jgi:ribonuclease P protein component
MHQTFHKKERLKSKVVLGELISHGNSVKKHPFVLIWKKVEEEQEFPIRIAFSVSKKRFPLAVDRNLMKRRINELYRKNKQEWYRRLSGSYVGLLVYTSHKQIKSNNLETKLISVFDRFIKDVEKVD